MALAHGLLAGLLDAEVDGAPLHDQQIAAELHTLLVTGSETVELASAAALSPPRRRRAEEREVLDDPGLTGALFAEAVRFDHPTDMLCHVVRHDVVVGDHLLPRRRGRAAAVGIGQPRRARVPRRRRVRRAPSLARDLLFGHGQHRCIGEHVAMRMGTAVLGALLTSIHDYEIDHAGVHRQTRRVPEGLRPHADHGHVALTPSPQAGSARPRWHATALRAAKSHKVVRCSVTRREERFGEDDRDRRADEDAEEQRPDALPTRTGARRARPR